MGQNFLGFTLTSYKLLNSLLLRLICLVIIYKDDMVFLVKQIKIKWTYSFCADLLIYLECQSLDVDSFQSARIIIVSKLQMVAVLWLTLVSYNWDISKQWAGCWFLSSQDYNRKNKVHHNALSQIILTEYKISYFYQKLTTVSNKRVKYETELEYK